MNRIMLSVGGLAIALVILVAVQRDRGLSVCAACAPT